MNPEDSQYLLDCLDDMLVIVDSSAVVTQMNRSAYETISQDYVEGGDVRQAVGKPLQFTLKDSEFYINIEEPLQQVISGQLENYRNQLAFNSGGTTGFFQITIFPDRDTTGITGAILTFKDLFYEKELQEQLLQTEELFTFKEVLLGAANELNNLLTIIGSSANLIQSRPGIDEKLFSDITMIGDQTLRAKGIVSNLLTLAKKHETKVGRVDLNQIIQKTFEIRQYELTVNNMLMEFDLNEVPLTVGDSYRIQQLILNLMNQSMESIIMSGLTGTIKISSGMEGDMLKLAISDNGPAFPEADLPQIFNAFYVNPACERKVSMGLSICRRIVAEHGGQISVKNVFPRGAEFIILIPVMDPQQYGIVSDTPDETLESGDGTHGAREIYKKIMVVDDEEGIRMVLSQLLESLGYEVILSADGRMALTQIIKEKPDAIISDMRMPHVNGKTLFKAIQKINPKLAANMMFITGDVVRSDSSSFLNEYNLPYLNKPFMLNDLERALDKLATTADARMNLNVV